MAKKIIKDLGLHYEKNRACPNDYILFWKNVCDDLSNKVTKVQTKL